MVVSTRKKEHSELLFAITGWINLKFLQDFKIKNFKWLFETTFLQTEIFTSQMC